MELEEVGKTVVDGALKVHSALGPGLLESTYEACLEHELRKRGLACERQFALPVVYAGIRLDVGYRVDLLVERRVVIELKAVEKVGDLHLAQLLSYLRLGNFKLGYLLNFNVTRMKHGIRRVANGLP